MRTILLILLPIFLFSQEQISDIKFYNSHEPTFTSPKIGFAKILDDQYLLKENDSLTIYKLENNSFSVSSVIPNVDCRKFVGYTSDPNRSLFEIRDNTYYRFLEDGIQLIDITTGDIVSDFDLSTHGGYSLNNIANKRVYLRDSNNELILNTETGAIDFINVSSPHSSTLRAGDIVIGITQNEAISIYNSHLKSDSIVYESAVGISKTAYSRQDSSFVFIENDGSIWKQQSDYTFQKLSVSLSTTQESTDWINGDNLIQIFNDNALVNGYDIVVTDLITGLETINFNTSELPSYVGSFQNVITENDDKNYSIIGFSGFNPTDGLNQGTYYIINHETQTHSKLPTISSIRNHTPFVFNGSIYMIGTYSSFWGFSEFIVRHNMVTRQTKFLYPHGENSTLYTTLGFDNGQDIINASNSRSEDSRIFSLEADESFASLISMDFRNNIGAINISDHVIIGDQLFVKSQGGLYTLDAETTLILPILSKDEFVSYDIVDPDILVNDNTVSIVDYNDSTAVFRVYDVSTGAIDSLVTDERITTYGGTVVLDDQLVYYEYGDEKVHCFDPTNLSITTFDSMSYISNSTFNLAKGETRCVRIENIAPNGNWAGCKAMLYNYDEKSGNRIDLDFYRSIDVVAGYNDSFYLTDGHDRNEEDTRIRLIKRDGSVSQIYEGKGFPYSNYDYVDQIGHPVSLIHLMENSETSIIVTNNLNSTEIIRIPNLQYGPHNETVLSQNKDKFIIQTIDSTGVHFWFYEAFKPMIELYEGSDARLLFSDFTEESAIVWLSHGNGLTSIVNYNFIDKQISIKDNLAADCRFPYRESNLYLGDNKFVMNLSCNVGYEPYVLDIEEGSFMLLSDLLEGEASSFPENFISFKNHLFFSALVKDGSRQWFRTIIDNETDIDEVKKDSKIDILAYPSPSNGFISLNQNAEKIYIHSMGGEFCLSQNNYHKGQPINISALNSGMYIITIIANNTNIYSIKFVKTD